MSGWFHLLFIPLVFWLGMFLGYIWAQKRIQNQVKKDVSMAMVEIFNALGEDVDADEDK